MNTDTPVFFTYVLKYVLSFLDDNLNGECEQFSNEKYSD